MPISGESHSLVSSSSEIHSHRSNGLRFDRMRSLSGLRRTSRSLGIVRSVGSTKNGSTMELS